MYQVYTEVYRDGYKMLTWIMSYLYAGGGVGWWLVLQEINSLENLRQMNCCVFPGLESGTGGWRSLEVRETGELVGEFSPLVVGIPHERLMTFLFNDPL